MRVRRTGPITYSVREHWNSKRIRLRVKAVRGVEVTTPKGYSLKEVDRFVRSNRKWIEETLKGVEAQKQNLAPSEVILHAVDMRWTISYQRESDVPGCSLHEYGGELSISGEFVNTALLSTVLRMWLSRKARQHLIPWLDNLSDELDLPYSKAIVRGQKTRWGSCSQRKTISLNRNLLFLDPTLARHVMVHELCHTVRSDHSPAFWSRLAEVEPDCMALEKATKASNDCVPTWARAE